MKAKIYKVTLGEAIFLVYGTSRASAVNNFLEKMKSDTESELAKGEEIYTLATLGAQIMCKDKYQPDPVDENQIPLPIEDMPLADAA